MATKANARVREDRVEIPAHPVELGAPRARAVGHRDIGEMRASLREMADLAARTVDVAEAADLLAELGESLLSTGSPAAIGVLDEALDPARASGDRAVVARVVGALDRALRAAG